MGGGCGRCLPTSRPAQPPGNRGPPALSRGRTAEPGVGSPGRGRCRETRAGRRRDRWLRLGEVPCAGDRRGLSPGGPSLEGASLVLSGLSLDSRAFLARTMEGPCPGPDPAPDPGAWRAVGGAEAGREGEGGRCTCQLVRAGPEAPTAEHQADWPSAPAGQPSPVSGTPTPGPVPLPPAPPEPAASASAARPTAAPPPWTWARPPIFPCPTLGPSGPSLAPHPPIPYELCSAPDSLALQHPTAKTPRSWPALGRPRRRRGSRRETPWGRGQPCWRRPRSCSCCATRRPRASSPGMTYR